MDLQALGLPPDAIINDVTIDYDHPLGVGSDAVVYQGRWHAPVAVKTLHRLLIEPGVHGRQSFLARFGRECVRLRDLRHENVVEFYGVCQTRDGSPSLVTEKMGSTLKNRYSAGGMSVADQLETFCDIAAGLTYIHRQGVIHRDLTTSNVLLNAHGRAKIADVGVSRSLRGDAPTSGMTACPGTQLYMPPEALADPPDYDERLDSFSFGVLMMAVITGREPSGQLLHAEPRFERLADGCRRLIPELERRAADFSAIPQTHPARELISRCLSNDRELRPRANELYGELLGKLQSIKSSLRPRQEQAQVR